MNDAAWERLTDTIDIKLGTTGHGRETRPLEDRPDLTESVQYICFQKDGQDFKLEHITGPAILDRKSHYSHRPGVANRVETIYDEGETSQRISLYQKHGEDWQAVELRDLDLG